MELERDGLRTRLAETEGVLEQLRAELQEVEEQQQTDAELVDGQFRDLEASLAQEQEYRREVELEKESLERVSVVTSLNHPPWAVFISVS